MKKGIVFMTKIPNKPMIDFCGDLLGKTNYDIFICVDDNLYKPEKQSTDRKIQYLQIDDNECIENGFQYAVFPMNLRTCSWDKTLYYFSNIDTSYDFLWVFEDDVFIPSIDAIQNLDILYSQYDLVTASNNCNNDGEQSWHWIQAKYAKIPLPWYCSMVCAFGISSKLLKCIDIYAKENRKLILTEILLNTLAMHNNLNVMIAPELSSIVYKHIWTFEDFKKNKLNLFHPVKDFKNHPIYRKSLLEN